jgi:hypothetical protein
VCEGRQIYSICGREDNDSGVGKERTLRVSPMLLAGAPSVPVAPVAAAVVPEEAMIADM